MPVTDDLARIDRAYAVLDKRLVEISALLDRNGYSFETGWYNGHFRRDENGQWQKEHYPIPVVGVTGFCDIEISFDRISVTAKLIRNKALSHHDNGFPPFPMEIYGVEDYLTDFYREGETAEEIRGAIARSGEKEIGFSFHLPFSADAQLLLLLLDQLKQDGFYY